MVVDGVGLELRARVFGWRDVWAEEGWWIVDFWYESWACEEYPRPSQLGFWSRVYAIVHLERYATADHILYSLLTGLIDGRSDHTRCFLLVNLICAESYAKRIMHSLGNFSSQQIFGGSDIELTRVENKLSAITNMHMKLTKHESYKSTAVPLDLNRGWILTCMCFWKNRSVGQKILNDF